MRGVNECPGSCDPIVFHRERVDVTPVLEEGCSFLSAGLMEQPCVSSHTWFEYSRREPHLAISICS